MQEPLDFVLDQGGWRGLLSRSGTILSCFFVVVAVPSVAAATVLAGGGCGCCSRRQLLVVVVVLLLPAISEVGGGFLWCVMSFRFFVCSRCQSGVCVFVLQSRRLFLFGVRRIFPSAGGLFSWVSDVGFLLFVFVMLLSFVGKLLLGGGVL